MMLIYCPVGQYLNNDERSGGGGIGKPQKCVQQDANRSKLVRLKWFHMLKLRNLFFLNILLLHKSVGSYILKDVVFYVFAV